MACDPIVADILNDETYTKTELSNTSIITHLAGCGRLLPGNQLEARQDGGRVIGLLYWELVIRPVWVYINPLISLAL